MTKETRRYTFMLPDPLKPGRMYRSRWKLTDEEAATHYPGAQRLDHTMEVVRPIKVSHSTAHFMGPRKRRDDDPPA